MNTHAFNSIDKILIPHTAFELAKTRILQHFEASKSCDEPIGLAIVGESRTGKSRVLEHVATMHPKERLKEGMFIPILSISTQSKPTVKGLAEIMLHAMGDPLWNRRASENEKTERLIILLAKSKTTMIMIDEFQHFFDKSSNKIQHHVADWLKILIDKTRVALVVSELPSCMAVISQNEQLSGRFTGAHMMPRFDWADPVGREEFRSTLMAFQEVLTDYEFPDFSSDNIAFRFYCASGGLVGYIAKILRQAIWGAIFENRKTIQLSNLAQAYEEAIWKGCLKPGINPFDIRFDPNPTPHMLEMAKTVGVAIKEDQAARSHKKIGGKALTSADALTA